MNTYVAHHDDNPVVALLWTGLSGFIPVAGCVLPLAFAIFYVRRNRDNRWLCIILIAIALIWMVIWVGVFAWQFGGSVSNHHSQPVKVP